MKKQLDIFRKRKVKKQKVPKEGWIIKWKQATWWATDASEIDNTVCLPQIHIQSNFFIPKLLLFKYQKPTTCKSIAYVECTPLIAGPTVDQNVLLFCRFYQHYIFFIIIFFSEDNQHYFDKYIYIFTLLFLNS